MIHDRPAPAPALAPPDLSAGAGPVVLVEGGLVVPPAKGLGNQSVQRSGVLRPDGSLVAESVTWRGASQVTIQPAMPPADAIRDLSGTWMFMGPLFGHFGHVLVESICRVWALDAVRDRIDGVVFVPKFQNRPGHVLATYRPLLEALGIDVPMLNLEDPTRVERLVVPPQGFGMFGMIEGTPDFRAFVRAYAGVGVAPKGAARIYVSRSGLPPGRGSLVGEGVVEERLRAEGYEVFHPQRHSFLDQIAAYKAATHVVAVDCSPLHLLALVGHAGQSVAVIARRGGDLDRVFARQIAAFTGARAVAINHLRRNWVEEGATRPSRTSWGEVDLTALGNTLRATGMIAGPAPWPGLTEAEVEREVARIAAAEGKPFHPFEDPRTPS